MIAPDDTSPQAQGDGAPESSEPELPPYKIEGARSSRSRCRSCRRKIEKGVLRLGILLEGPYGTGYVWHHLTCAARRRFEDVEQAYAQEAWEAGVDPPPLAELSKLREAAEKQKQKRAEIPHVERAPTGRSKCRSCDELIAKGDLRVVLLREVEFYGQVRASPVNVHARCVAGELRAEDCLTEVEGFAEALRRHSSSVPPEDVEEALAAIGELP